jgi:uncharacterized repeat protein (TIGR01451 family)
MHPEHDLTRRSRLAAVLLGAALLTLGGAGGTAYADTPDPQLSITVDNGSTSARSGDELGYTVTVTNVGSQKVRDLRVSQTVPDGASFVSADHDGDEAKGTIRWSVDLDPAEKITVRTTTATRARARSAGRSTWPRRRRSRCTRPCRSARRRGPRSGWPPWPAPRCRPRARPWCAPPTPTSCRPERCRGCAGRSRSCGLTRLVRRAQPLVRGWRRRRPPRRARGRAGDPAPAQPRRSRPDVTSPGSVSRRA